MAQLSFWAEKEVPEGKGLLFTGGISASSLGYNK